VSPIKGYWAHTIHSRWLIKHYLFALWWLNPAAERPEWRADTHIGLPPWLWASTENPPRSGRAGSGRRLLAPSANARFLITTARSNTGMTYIFPIIIRLLKTKFLYLSFDCFNAFSE
jgi:hypothetical protein